MTDEAVRRAMYLRGWDWVIVMESVVITQASDRTSLKIFCRPCLERYTLLTQDRCEEHTGFLHRTVRLKP